MEPCECVLVIVDMQADFSASLDNKLNVEVMKLISTAIDKGYPIINLWMPFFKHRYHKPYQETHAAILEAVKDYSKFFSRTKSRNDGSFEVSQVCKHFIGTPKLFKICGVNTDYCVSETADGLAIKYSGSIVEVCKSATATQTPDWSWDKWDALGHFPNVHLSG